MQIKQWLAIARARGNKTFFFHFSLSPFGPFSITPMEDATMMRMCVCKLLPNFVAASCCVFL